MKNRITIIAFFTFVLCNAQGLKITYTEAMDLSDKLKGIENPIIRQAVMQKIKPKKYELISIDGVSIYQNKVEKDNDVDNGVLLINSSEYVFYKNHKNKESVLQTDFMSRVFLIKEKLNPKKWEITNETKKIGNYSCKKAVLKDKNIIAWFTNEVPSNEGPREFYGLPGLILEVKTNTKKIKATDIKILKEKIKINPPAKGTKITRKEFDKIKKEKIKSLTGGKQKGNGVQVIKM